MNINGDCYMTIHHTTTGDSRIAYLPCYPEEISDSVSVNWSDTTIVNRSSPLASYVNTGYRSVSFTMTLHREMYGSDDRKSLVPQIDKILKYIRGAAYPRYTGSLVIPPIVSFVFGSEFKTKGILRSSSFTWKKPIINGKYYLCDVSIQMDEPLEGTASVTSIVGCLPGDPFSKLDSVRSVSTNSTSSKKSDPNQGWFGH